MKIFSCLFLSLFSSKIILATPFLIGACIGPKKAFERYLDDNDKQELTLLIEQKFDGQNKDEVINSILDYLKERLTNWQWESIQDEVKTYQKLNLACSPYSQLLPPRYFKPLLLSVRKAQKMGAGRRTIKFLVDDYLDRILLTRDFNREFRRTQDRSEEEDLVENNKNKRGDKTTTTTKKTVPNKNQSREYLKKTTKASKTKATTRSKTKATTRATIMARTRSTIDRTTTEKPAFPMVEPWKIIHSSLQENLWHKVG